MAHKDADELMLAVLGTLNEAQARWYVAREALARGRGGLKRLHEVTGMSRPTILKGIRELQQGTPLEPTTRIRRPGGGRRRLEAADPRFARALERLMEENTAGDPMSLLRWTNKSTARIAAELTRQGHRASDETVRRRLRELGYSLQANVKTLEGSSPPERDAQFRYLNAQVRQFLARGQPVLSVDTKKKDWVGGVQEPGANVAAAGDAPGGQHVRLPDPGDGHGDPLWRVRRAARRRLRQRRNEPRHRGVRRGEPAPVVARVRAPALPTHAGAARVRRRRGQQWQPESRLEVLPATPRGRAGAADHGLPLPAWHEQVEQDRTPHVLLHQRELEGAAVGQL